MSLPIPPIGLRRCGGKFLNDNDYYRKSCLDEAERVRGMLEFSADITICDFGCGAGRLAQGLQQLLYEGKYFGIDVCPERIRWCKNTILGDNYSFIRVNSDNRRYNNTKHKSLAPVPLNDGSVDIFYAQSVFTHFTPEETRFYANEASRVVKPGGKVFLTAYVEDEVPDFEENPKDYVITPQRERRLALKPLHRARYAKDYFDKIWDDSFELDRFEHGTEYNKQSAYYFSRR